MLNIGLDIGGTKIELQVLESDGTCIYRQREPTCKTNYEQFVLQVVNMILTTEAHINETCTVGIGIPGSPDPVTGLIKNSNILAINNNPLSDRLQTLLKRPVSISNDANCFTLSEAIDGAGEGFRSVFGVILGTGCGGGLVINQTIQQGRNGNCGEWGHIPLPYYDSRYDGPEDTCYCGHSRCIESFISGTGISRQLRLSYNHQMDSVHFFQNELSKDDSKSRKCLTLFQDQIARSFAMVVNMLDPDAIVIGGGLSNVPQLFDGINDLIGKYTFGHYTNLAIRIAHHGDSSGVRGAAWLGKANHHCNG